MVCLGDEARVDELKDRITEALDGVRVTADTLDDLAATFSFSLETVDILKLLLVAEGEDAEALLASIADDAAGPRPYRTVQLHEVHELGSNGWPVRHTTIQTIEALKDGLDTIEYTYVPGVGTVTVVVTAGGILGPTRSLDRPELPGLRSTTIKLTKVLAAGDPHDMTFETRFAYKQQPEMVFRRGLSPQVEIIAIKLVFHRARLPALLWETEWGGQDGQDIVNQTRVRLGPNEPSVELLRRRPTARWIGYAWEW
jgi:hypothetical protein